MIKPYTYNYKDYRKEMTAIETKDNEENIVVMSYNIRTYTNDDKYEKCFVFRAPFVKKNIEATNPDIIGFQEYTSKHEKFIRKILVNYDYVITYRDESDNS